MSKKDEWTNDVILPVAVMSCVFLVYLVVAAFVLWLIVRSSCIFLPL